jgi:hypothetical protein
MSDKPERDFKGIWIPKELWFDQSLTPLQKMLIAEIDSLSKGPSGCTADNAYLAKFFGVSEGTMANMITDLRKLKRVETLSFDGRNRVLRVIPNESSLHGKHEPCFHEKGEDSLHGNHESLLRSDNKEDNKGEVVVKKKGKKVDMEPLLLESETGIKPFPFMDLPEFKTAWAAFKKSRKKKLDQYTEATILKRIAERPQFAMTVVRTMLEFSWESFEWEWDKLASRIAKSPAHTQPKKDPSAGWERYPEFIATHPAEKARKDYPHWKNAASNPIIKSQFERWLKTGSYDL